jgi:uncharacterized membrane protein
MTFLMLLTLICFTTPPGMGFSAGKSGGISTAIAGALVGLLLGAVAHQTLKLTYQVLAKHYDEKAHPQVIQALVGFGICIWIFIVILGAGMLSAHVAEAIVHRYA